MTNSIKVLHLLASQGYGGLEKHTIELVNALAEQGMSVGLAADESFRTRVNSQVDFLPWATTRSRWNPLIYLTLWRLIKRYRPNIVHAQARKSGWIVSRVSKLFPKIKFLVTIHNTSARRLGFVSNLDAVIGVSDTVVRLIDHPFKYRVYNGISLPKLDEAVVKVDFKGKWFLAVGRLVPAKGFDILIESIKNTGINLVIVGDGPDRAALEALMLKLELSDQIRFLGYRSDIISFMKAASAVVISSRKEGFSYVLAEALMTYTPVVSTDVPVANEVLPKHLLCDCNSPVQLSNLVKNIDFQDPAYPALYERARREFTTEAMVRETQKVYRTLLSSL